MNEHNPAHLASISEILIGACYFVIPAALVASAVARRKFLERTFIDPGNILLILFAAFILSCGVGHFLDAWFTYHGQCAALSDVKIAWNWITAAVSVLTMVILVPLLPNYISILYKPVDEAALYRTIELLKERLERSEKLFP